MTVTSSFLVRRVGLRARRTFLSDYEERFGHLPMDEYRRKMSPEVFALFTRFVGVVKAPPRWDAVEATRLP